MDISRLPSSGLYPSSYPVPSGNRGARERALELVSEVATIRPVRELAEKVVQGEVLQRQRATQYSSTRDYLVSRLFDGAAFEDMPDSGSRANPGTAGRVVGAYLSNTRELIQPDVNRGKQVDYFV
jgi:hypothetical protein